MAGIGCNCTLRYFIPEADNYTTKAPGLLECGRIKWRCWVFWVWLGWFLCGGLGMKGASRDLIGPFCLAFARLKLAIRKAMARML
jgi:hypothetical protein